MFHNVEEEKKMGLFFLDLTYLHNVYICSIYAVKQLKKKTKQFQKKLSVSKYQVFLRKYSFSSSLQLVFPVYRDDATMEDQLRIVKNGPRLCNQLLETRPGEALLQCSLWVCVLYLTPFSTQTFSVSPMLTGNSELVLEQHSITRVQCHPFSFILC